MFTVIGVFLVRSAPDESSSAPLAVVLAVVLAVPMCVLSASVGVALARMAIDIFVPMGFVVLVGLARKKCHSDR